MSEVRSFWSLKAGSQVFVLLMLFICVLVHTMWSGKSMHLMCILHWYIVFICHHKIILAMCMLVGIVVCAKADSVSSVNWKSHIPEPVP